MVLRDSNEKDYQKTTEVRFDLLPRFFLKHYESGVASMQLGIDGARESPTGNGSFLVEADRARITYWFMNGTQVCTLLDCFTR